MGYIEDLLLCSIYFLFPILIYYFYIAYNKKFDNRENNLIFGFALYSSLFLIIFKGSSDFPRTALLMGNIPIILAYIKNRKTDLANCSFMV